MGGASQAARHHCASLTNFYSSFQVHLKCLLLCEAYPKQNPLFILSPLYLGFTAVNISTSPTGPAAPPG